MYGVIRNSNKMYSCMFFYRYSILTLFLAIKKFSRTFMTNTVKINRIRKDRFI